MCNFYLCTTYVSGPCGGQKSDQMSGAGVTDSCEKQYSDQSFQLSLFYFHVLPFLSLLIFVGGGGTEFH